MKKLIFTISLILLGFILMAQNKEFNNVKVLGSFILDSDSMRHTTKMDVSDDTLLTKKWAEHSLVVSGEGLFDTLQYYPKKPIIVYNTIPVTTRNISVNYGVTMTNTGYKFNAFAWYDSPTGRVYNGMTEPDTTLTGFTCTVNVPQGYLFYEATDSSGFLSEESGWDEHDPNYASDSSFIKTGIREWNSSVSKGLTSGDTTRWALAINSKAPLTSPNFLTDVDIQGNGSSSPILIVGNDKDATKDSTFTILANGNVGVGASPTEKLTVNGGNLNFATAGQYGLKWPGGSRLYEQTVAQGGVDRMLCSPNGSEFDVLNEAGNAYIASFSSGRIDLFAGGNQYFTLISGGNVGIGTTAPGSKLTISGHIGTLGTIPVLTGAGTGASIATGSTDTAGEITEGTLAAGAVITFATAYTNVPFAIVVSESGLLFSYTVSTTAITITNIGALSSTKLTYQVIARE